MELDMLSILLIGGISLVIGLLIGLALSSLFRSEEEKPSISQQDVDPNWVEVAHFWWDRRNSDLVLRVGNQTYLERANLKSAERKRLIRMLNELHVWLAQEPLPEVEKAVLGAKMPSLEFKVAPESPNLLLNPVDAIVTAIQSDAPKVDLSSASIVQQINAILQTKLAETNMKDKAIRLMELPNKGMVVLIGLDQYEGIDAVPDPEVQAILREAVAEWEVQAAAKGD
jgi:hypothetical protein